MVYLCFDCKATAESQIYAMQSRGKTTQENYFFCCQPPFVADSAPIEIATVKLSTWSNFSYALRLFFLAIRCSAKVELAGTVVTAGLFSWRGGSERRAEPPAALPCFLYLPRVCCSSTTSIIADSQQTLVPIYMYVWVAHQSIFSRAEWLPTETQKLAKLGRFTALFHIYVAHDEGHAKYFHRLLFVRRDFER